MGQKKLENMFKEYIFWNLPEAFVENAEKTIANRQSAGQLGQNDYAFSTKGKHFEPQGLHENGCR